MRCSRFRLAAPVLLACLAAGAGLAQDPPAEPQPEPHLALGPRADWTTVRWSPDGSVAAVGGGVVALLEPASGGSRGQLGNALEQPGLGEVIWGPDSSLLVSRTGRHRLTVWTGATARSLRTLETTRVVADALWSPDGSTLAVVEEDRLSLWNPRTGERLAEVELDAWGLEAAFLWPGGLGGTGCRVSPRGFQSPRWDPRCPVISAWSPSGDRLAVLTDRRVHVLAPDGRELWRHDVPAGQIGTLVRSPHRPPEPPPLLAWSPDDELLAVGGGRTYLLDGTTGDVQAEYDLPQGRVEYRDPATGAQRVEEFPRLPPPPADPGGPPGFPPLGGGPLDAQYFGEPIWSPAGDALALVSSQGAPLLVERSGRPRGWLLPPDPDPENVAVNQLRWLPGGERLATLRGGELTLWNAREATAVTRHALPVVGRSGPAAEVEVPCHFGPALFSWSPDGRWLVVAEPHPPDTPDGRLPRRFGLWDAAAGERRFELEAAGALADWPEYRPIEADEFHWSPTSEFVVWVPLTGEAVVAWETAAGRLRHTFSPAPPGSVHPTIPVGEWSPSGDAFSAPIGVHPTVGLIFDAATGAPRAAGPSWVAWSPDGTLLAGVDSDRMTVRVLDARTGEERRRFAQRNEVVARPRWSPDGSLLAVASRGGEWSFWELAEGRLRGVVSDVPAGGAWSPDGRLFATGAAPGRPAERVNVWDAATLQQRGSPGRFEDAVAWSADGRSLLLRGGSVRWNVETGQLQRSPTPAELLGLPPDRAGRRVEVQISTRPAGDRTLLQVGERWSEGSYLVIHAPDGTHRSVRLRGQVQLPRGSEWSPDGSRVLTWEDDGTGSLWNAEDGAEIARFGGPGSPGGAARWSPDGRRLLTNGPDGLLRLWDGADGRLLATICAAGPDDWLIFTPAGYFHAAGEGYGWLRWRVGEEIFPLERFRERFEDPAKVREALAGGR